jgi:hypothetical protein
MLIPFFNDFIVQLGNVAKWFGALTQTTAFASHTKNAGVITFWKFDFEQMSAQVTEVRAQEGVLVSHLRDIARKQGHVESLLKVVEPAMKQLTMQTQTSERASARAIRSPC